MSLFELSAEPINVSGLCERFTDAGAGAFVTFEGWVRDFNEGKRVLSLEYEAYDRMAISEGQRLIAEIVTETGARAAYCVHRTGLLEIGDLAVWVGVSATHRAEAFAACKNIIDEVKICLPIWKKEFYSDGDSGWVNCDRCAKATSRESEA